MIYSYEKTPVNIDRLTMEIKNSSMSVDAIAMNFFEGNLEIEFENTLSSSDEAVLDDLVTDHSGSPIPPDVTPRQIRQALILSGVSMQSIADALSTLPSPQKELAQTEWEYSTMFIRTNPLVNSVGAMLGWTSAQLDNLWNYARTL